MAAGAPSNTLGLDFESDSGRIQEPPDALKPSIGQVAMDPKLADDTKPSLEQLSPRDDDESTQLDSNNVQSKEKKKPYVNPERVKTGGTQRDKLSEEELGERMLRMREQNEKIKQRRMDVKADEDAFKKTQESERIKLAQSRKVQEHVNRTREQNARRKMDKVQTREWDSGKPSAGDWKQVKKTPTKEGYLEEGWASARGGLRGQGRSRDQGRSVDDSEGTTDKTVIAGSGHPSPATP